MSYSKQINCCIDCLDYKAFQVAYPSMLSRFVRNAISLALKDKKFFDLVVFGDSYASAQKMVSDVHSKNDYFNQLEIY